MAPRSAVVGGAGGSRRCSASTISRLRASRQHQPGGLDRASTLPGKDARIRPSAGRLGAGVGHRRDAPLNAIEPRRLGRSDVTVSPVIFGAWAVGGWMWGGTDEAESIAAIQASIDHGVTTIDTAAIYGQGYSEEVVGKAIKGRRDRVQIATKCGMRWDIDGGLRPLADQGPPGPRRRHPQELPAREHRLSSASRASGGSASTSSTSIRSTGPTRRTPVEDTMAALVKLKEQGKIRAIGVSNYDVAWLQAGRGRRRRSRASSRRTA